ncbi:MAG TPA: hypothetical protein VH592_04190 [Gemmataceae bacterium]|jgi:hypothetical protein
MFDRFMSFRKPSFEVCRPTGETTSFRPCLERLEEREVPSANPLDALLGSAPGLVPIQFNSLTNGAVNPSGQLQYTAQGQIGVIPFSVPVTISATPGSNGSTVLDLDINPIHLDLLGLNVQTSAICLDITAQPGPGNLLGNLLSDVGGLLNANTGNLSSVLSNPLTNLLFSLTTTALLDGALNAATAPSSLGTSSAATNDNVLPPGANDILHLSLGPVDLNLLGLNVDLDNCNDGPVVVDVYTEPGLLGSLLNNVSNLLNPGQNNLGAEQLLGNLVNNVVSLI